jgi:predicted oxidoreductase (fatty acid repression mutant protein)
MTVEAVSTAGHSPFLTLLGERRTVRSFGDGEIEPGLFEILTRAVEITPAAFNRPPWHVLIVHEDRNVLWEQIEESFRARLSSDRLERYLDRLSQFSNGLGAILIFEDKRVKDVLQSEHQLSGQVAHEFVHQALGMVQLSLWLTLTSHGLGTSLQHWDWLIESDLPRITGLSTDDFKLSVVMPFGVPDEEPRQTMRTRGEDVVSVDSLRVPNGACI